MTNFKKTNKERRALMNINSNFKTFLKMTPTRANKDAKWIIRGFISGRRNYNKKVMKQLYDIMFNVRLRRRDYNNIAVYVNTEENPYWTNIDAYQELSFNNDDWYRPNNSDEKPIHKRVMKGTKYGKVVQECVMVKLQDDASAKIWKAKNNYLLFKLDQSVETNRCVYKYGDYSMGSIEKLKYSHHLVMMKCLNKIWTNSFYYGTPMVLHMKAYELKRLATINKIKGRSKMKKGELFKALKKL